MTDLPGLSRPIVLDYERALNVSEGFQLDQMTTIFAKYLWMNDTANEFMHTAEANGEDQSFIVSHALGLAIGGLVLDDQEVCLDAKPEDVALARFLVGTSMQRRDDVFIGTDGNSFGSTFRDRNPVYTKVLEATQPRVVGDRFVFGASLCLVVADVISGNKVLRAAEFN